MARLVVDFYKAGAQNLEWIPSERAQKQKT
jgi:hypothetical protein